MLEVSVDVDIAETAGENPVDLLAEASGLSKSIIKHAMTLGAVWVTRGKKTKRLRRAKGSLQVGDKLGIFYDEKILTHAPPPPVLIKHETAYSVWYKPAGLMSSGSRFGDHWAIDRWVETNIKPQKPVFLVHRLDRFATGLILLAHTKQAARHLSEQFRKRTVRKIYRVAVQGLLHDSQTINSPLDGKEAISVLHPIEANEALNQSLLEVEIKTGRKHQIRRHLAGINLPVLGDRQYGNTQTGELQLAACEITIKHPKTGSEETYTLDQHLRPKLGGQIS